jgi:hypothetical protein
MRKFTSVICAMLLAATALFAQEQPTGVFMNLFANDMAQPKGISENGKWACGSAFWTGAENQTGTINASIWNLETGERKFLATAEEGMSEANCVNNEGTIPIQPEFLERAEQEIKELHNIEVDMPKVRFTFEELESVSFKPSALRTLIDFIEQ